MRQKTSGCSSAWNNNTLNSVEGTTRYTLVSADGGTTIGDVYNKYGTKTYNGGNNSFPGLSSTTSYTPATGCALTEIKESAGVITFKYNGGVAKTKASYEFVTDHCTAPADGEVNINDPLSVVITPASGYTLADPSCWTVEMGGVALTYGTDFTYNTTTNTFSIASLTDDVVIMAEAKLIRTVTWSVNGLLTPVNFADGATLVLPSNPSDCSGAGGKKFVGWTASSSVSGSAPADLFTEAGTKTVTANITYYAVYATASSGSGSGTPEKASSIAVGDEVVLVCESASKELSGFTTSGTIYGQGTPYSGTPAGTYSFTVVAGSAEGSFAFERDGKYWNWSTGNSLSTSTSLSNNSSWNVTFDDGNAFIANVSDSSRKIRWNAANTGLRFACYTSDQTDVQLYKIGAGTSYSDYSLTCGTPCSNTPVMSFTDATVNKTTADASYTQAVTITGKGSGQTVAYSSSDETVATVNSSGVVTLKGKIGTTTITASVEANGTYCGASASYTLNVTAAPINVTLYYNGTSTILNNQTNPYTLPTGAPYNTAMCSGDWTFAGWYNSAYDKNTTAPTYITELTTTGSAYAVYTTTEASGSGGSSATTISAEDFSSVGTGNEIGTQEISGITITGAQNTHNTMGPKYYSGTPNTIRCYVGNKLTISASSTISQIDFTYDGSYSGGTINLSKGAWESTPTTDWDQTWKGSASSIDFIIGGTSQWRITAIKVTVGGGGSSTTYYATTPECSTPPTIDYTVTWKACGETFHTQGFAEGAALVLPASTPADNAGKTFVGWTETEHHTGAGAPADLFTTAGSKTVTADVTYYAVFH